MRHFKLFILAGVAALSAAVPASAQTGNKAEEDALFKKAEAFVAAFNKGDAKAVAACWTPDGIYRDQHGQEMKGRDAIEKTFRAVFEENKGLKLRINITGLRFVTKDVSVEEGTTEVLHPDGSPPSQANYTILHVKKDGDWYLDIVKESVYTAPTNHKHLSVLEWAIGDWADDSDGGEIGRLSFSWGPNQNFIVGTFATTFKNISLSSGTQWIGWDPAAKQLRSWTFDGSGTFGEATWTAKDGSWIVKSQTTLRDGKKATSTNIITPLDANTVTWRSTNRTVDGEALPDTKAIKMKRVK